MTTTPEPSDGVHCRCDLDRWQPEKETGHSWVCPIHKAMLAAKKALLGRGGGS